ncbi:unnamed protein product [Adineta steineri]|uniref:Uncharacterized protein n=1 Tax=Adineta steineri TaxID=433720 RepID=A0A813X2Q1_9BILA|nr:unnamed protein product [Adineta steineri]CAF1485411.1 unnamed protein product [Adineta steineri]CAF1565313.1 unnamed protein product [Adineta steineri]CAF1639765.1 unnamed protein product [Adineta steineri]
MHYFVFVLLSVIVSVKSETCNGIAQYDQCSANNGCGCFHMSNTMNDTGICGFLWVTCSRLQTCDSSNNTCQQPDTICVRHPQCHDYPICYPVTMTDERICPPIIKNWNNTSNMNNPRHHHTTSVLSDGHVLVTGGDTIGALDSAELYDPSTETWTITGKMNVARSQHTASILIDGKVLVTGGYNGNRLASAELYDLSTKTWLAVGNMIYARSDHIASTLTNGKVLVSGGYGTTYINSSELYDPSSETWTITGEMKYSRDHHTVSLLPNGKILVTGGRIDFSTALNSAELF